MGNMLFRIAASKGFCEKYGITCELKIIASGPLGASALLSRSIDVGFFPAEVQISAMIAGAKLKAILSGARLNPFAIIVRNEIEIPAAGKRFPDVMADLKGRKIGVPARGGSAELQFGLLAKKAGLAPTDFTYVAVGAPSTSYGALISKQIDASMAYEPSGSLCEVLRTCTVLFNLSEASEPPEIARTNGGVTNSVVTEEMAEEKPQVVDALIAAARDAESFVQDPANFDEALRIAKSFFRFDLPQGDEIMELSFRRILPTLRIPIDRSALNQIAENMLTMRQIDAPFDTARLVHTKAP
ncbi:ABC transporter substrate-binding protein [Bradyrhizobium sp. 521_C7_N1_3]|uniref:ABC transporter substrate-binding protein n=1 Tax=Bradyrhizobium sp. 521_C7_N1_3 TaxID=3240368 RepID=UPI003F8861EF